MIQLIFLNTKMTAGKNISTREAILEETSYQSVQEGGLFRHGTRLSK